jgi:hypothetical protein
MESCPKLKALDRFHFPVIIGMKISLRGADMGMAHQSLDGPQIIPIIQEGRGEGMPDHMRMNPLLNQCLPRHGLDQAINWLWRLDFTAFSRFL